MSTSLPSQPETIQKSKVVIAEGLDAKLFLIHALSLLNIPGKVQVLDFGNIQRLPIYLKMLRTAPGFELIETLVVARDAEADPSAAMASITNSLGRNGFAHPSRPFEFANGNPRTGILLFPGYAAETKEREWELLPGSLEDLCLATIEPNPILECVDQYLQCVERTENGVTHPRKSKLHAYLAGNKKYVGMKIGQATEAKAWNLNHPAFSRYRKLLLAM